MTKFNTQRGFTLVELAIVLTIIGLLIGGILKGRQLMTNARITATIAQINATEAAVIAFKDTYNATPGDMPNANERIPNCAQCIPFSGGTPADIAGGGAGDGAIGVDNWNLRRAQGATAVAPNSSTDNETLYFWAELAQAGLISSVSYNGDPIGGGQAQFGVHAPNARVGGGLIVGYATGSVDQPMASPVPAGPQHTRLAGTVLVLTNSLTADLSTAAGAQPLSPNVAAQIDRKSDDGLPLTGDTQAYGFNTGNNTAGCFGQGIAITAATPITYNEALSGKDCGLFFEINN